MDTTSPHTTNDNGTGALNQSKVSGNSDRNQDQNLVYFTPAPRHATNSIGLTGSDSNSSEFSSNNSKKLSYKNFDHVYINKGSPGSTFNSQVYPTSLHPLSDSSDSSTESSSSETEDLVSKEDEIRYYYSKNFTRYFHQLINPSDITSKNKELVWEDLHNLGQNFVEDAIKYGKIIIEERHLPARVKSIIPLPLGGFAGGEKYICNGILFKLPMDKLINSHWLYGGNKPDHDKAAEAARLELLSSNYVGSYDPFLMTPLTAVVSYGGFLVLATSLLPIKTNTLIYGSSDGSKHVYASNAKVNQKMGELGKALNLKSHTVNNTEMALCGDIEVHQLQFDYNGPQYNFIIDPARLFPPEILGNDSSKWKNILWKKLPPEFVRNYRKPLSSDGFTYFQSNRAEREENNRDLIIATLYFYDIYLPKYIKNLLNSEVIKDLLSATSPYHTLFFLNKTMESHQNSLLNHMHRHGIGIRHLGKISQILEKYDENEFKNVKLLKNYIYNVIISRAIKNYADNKLKGTNRFTERKEILKKILNDITTPSPSQNKFWISIVPLLVQKKFNVKIKNILSILNKGFQLVNFCELMGINLSPETYEAIKNQYNRKENIRTLTKVFSQDEFQFYPTVQYSNLIDLAAGMHYLNQHFHYKNLPEMSDYASNCRRISYNRLKSALETWTNLEHPILPNNILGLTKIMNADIQEEKNSKQFSAFLQTKKTLSSSTTSEDFYDTSSDSLREDKDKETSPKHNRFSLKRGAERVKSTIFLLPKNSRKNKKASTSVYTTDTNHSSPPAKTARDLPKELNMEEISLDHEKSLEQWMPSRPLN